jgi:predicted kinase
MDSFQKVINKLPKEIIQKLKETQQNEKYHPEGNCYNHIWLVYDSILKNDNFESKELKNDMLIIAIFHDLGKIQATRFKKIKDGTEKLVAYNHESYCKDYLDKYLDLFEYNDKEMIYEVCQNHMRAHLFDKMRDSKQLIFMKNKYYKETILFSHFDNMGKEKIPTFIMTVGIPGSGKSFWVFNCKKFDWIGKISGYHKNSENIIICPDQIRKELTGSISNISRDKEVWKLAKLRVMYYLKEGKNVILDSTMVKSSSRKDFIKELPLCFRYAKIFECTPEIVKQRIAKDIEDKIDRSHVPDEVVDRMYENFIKDKDKIFEDGFEILE